MQKNTTRILLGLILASAFILRIWGLGLDELIFDEGLYSFRSIGYLDYLESPYQTTPVQWFTNGERQRTILSESEGLPWWLNLSFHDHPPLLFLIQHLFFSIFGDSLFAARLPSALFGLASVYLIYLIGRKLFDEKMGLISAFIFAVSFAHASVSRLAMMEGLLFFFILANIYYFLKFLGSASSPQAIKRDWWKFGLTFGLAILTKYIAVFLLPVYLTIWILKSKDRPSSKHILGAAGIALIIFSPVIVYNILSYKTFGHFDLQLAYILKQKTPWPVNEFGGKTQEPFSDIWGNLTTIFSLPFLIVAVVGLGFLFWKNDRRKKFLPMILLFLSATLLLTQTGAAIRFVSLYIISFVFFAAVPFVLLWNKKPKLAFILFTIFAAHEIFFTAERIFINPPDYGVVKLDKYLESVLGNGRSEIVPQHPNPYLNAVIQKHAASIPITLEPTGLIYDDNLATNPMLWLFARREYYHAIPIMTASKFQESLKNNPAMFKNVTLYFAKAEPAAPVNPIRQTDYAKQVEQFLISQNQKPVMLITGSENMPAFRVYKFSLK
ncbi:MAG: glycosyltransferase family 39 protein [Parcubacteria group bacterium]|nr:glycosyltransferase family 39 protein [Parcubacteria group bacterium]